jgi:hypothetical protein
MSISLQASQTQINAIEDAPGGDVRISFMENVLFKGRFPKERCLTEFLRERGYGVVPGNPVFEPGVHTLIVSKLDGSNSGRPLKSEISALLKSHEDIFLLNPEIRDVSPGHA